MLEGNLALHRQLREALPRGGAQRRRAERDHLPLRSVCPAACLGAESRRGHLDRRWLAAAHPISSYLLRPYTVIYGYLGCAPPSNDQLYAAWNEAYEHWGVIPTLKPDLAQLRSPPVLPGSSLTRRVLAGQPAGDRPGRPLAGRVAFPFRTADGRRAVRTTDGRFVCQAASPLKPEAQARGKEESPLAGASGFDGRSHSLALRAPVGSRSAGRLAASARSQPRARFPIGEPTMSNVCWASIRSVGILALTNRETRTRFTWRRCPTT